MDDKVVKRRAVCIRHGSLLQEIVPASDGSRFEQGLGFERILELLVNFGEQPRQVPGCKILTRCLGRGGSLHETPAVSLKVFPVPMRQQRIQHRHHFRWGLGNFGFEPGDFFFRVIALDVPFQGDFFADCFHGLGVGLFSQSRRDDWLEIGDRGFRQTFIDRVVDRFPLSIARCGQEAKRQE